MLGFSTDRNEELMLDGNALAGLLHDLFALEMTASPAECGHCGYEGEIGSLLAFVHAPGYVLRCPGCKNVILRIVETPEAFYLDARGAAFIRFSKR